LYDGGVGDKPLVSMEVAGYGARPPYVDSLSPLPESIFMGTTVLSPVEETIASYSDSPLPHIIHLRFKSTSATVPADYIQ
jgi:hypothetical protein